MTDGKLRLIELVCPRYRSGNEGVDADIKRYFVTQFGPGKELKQLQCREDVQRRGVWLVKMGSGNRDSQR